MEAGTDYSRSYLGKRRVVDYESHQDVNSNEFYYNSRIKDRRLGGNDYANHNVFTLFVPAASVEAIYLPTEKMSNSGVLSLTWRQFQALEKSKLSGTCVRIII